MNMLEALKKCDETMRLAAQFQKDKGAMVYTAEMHCTAAGLALRQVIAPKSGEGLEPSSANIGTLFHALYNHSAWRQKFEKAGLFPKKEARTLDASMAELEEEFGE